MYGDFSAEISRNWRLLYSETPAGTLPLEGFWAEPAVLGAGGGGCSRVVSTLLLERLTTSKVNRESSPPGRLWTWERPHDHPRHSQLRSKSLSESIIQAAWG